MSSRSSSRRKEESGSKGKKKDVAVVSDDSGDEAETEEETEIVSLSGEDASSDEVIAPKKSRGCSYNKSAFSMPDDISKLMNRVLCTACGKQLNPMNQGAVRKHPWLKVVTCRKCYKFLKSGPFTRDREGTDEQCRWCGDGGRLYGCDYCHNCFCRSCIKRNMGRTEAADMENEDTKSKWKCYMCKPKKIRALAENCSKILDYIKSEEDKEKKREERALQREKEKAQAAKEKRNATQNGKEKGNEQKDRHASQPPPVPKAKINLDEKKDKQQPRSLLSGTKPIAPKPNPDCIIIGDGPDYPRGLKNITVKGHQPLYNSKPGDGVKHISKFENGVTQVVVGPKPKMAISMPYKDNTKLDALVPGRPALYGALTTSQSPSSKVSLFNPTPVSSIGRQNTSLLSGGGVKGTAQQPKANDLRALKEQIVPFNVETLTEKMTTVSQAFNLMLSSVKTDLAIAKLSSANVFQSRNAAAFTVKTGFETFFNNIRDLFNVQIVMNSPIVNDSGNPINIDDDNDVKTDVKTEPGLSNGGSSENTKDIKPEVKKEKSESIKEEAKKDVVEVEKEKETIEIKEEKVEDSQADEMEVEGDNTDANNDAQEESMDVSGSNEENNLDRDVEEDESDGDYGKDVKKSSNKKEKIKDDKKNTDKDKRESMENIEKKSSEKECSDKKLSSEKERKDKKSSERKDKKDSDKGEKKNVESSTEKLDKDASENDVDTPEKDESEKKKSKNSLSMKAKSDSEKDAAKESKAKSRKLIESNESDTEDRPVESGSNVKTASDLDLLKELADEINDSNDKDDSSDESVIRRSSRRGKTQTNDKEKGSSEDVSETSESNVGRSSRNKSSSKNREKIDKDDQKSSKSNKSESSTTDTSQNKSEDAKGRRFRKEKMERKDESSQDEEIDEPIEDEEGSKRKSSRNKSKNTDESDLKKKNVKSKDKKESIEESLSEDTDEKEEVEEKTRKVSGSKSNSTDKKDLKKSKDKKESKEEPLSETEDMDEEEEVEEKTRKGSGSKSNNTNKKDLKKSKDKKESKEESLSEDMDEEEEVEEKTRKGSGSKSKVSDKKDSKKSKDKKESKEESLSETEDMDEEEEIEEKTKESGSKSKVSNKKDSKKSKDKKESKEESLSETEDMDEEEEVEEKTRKGSGSKSNSSDKKDSKKSMKESKNEQEENGEEEDEEISSDSDSSIASEEFGKRKKKRKSRANKEESEENKPRKSKGNKKGKETSRSERTSRARSAKNDKNTEDEDHSDSSNFDADLEKEIKQLSKDTKLSRATRSGASKPSEKDTESKGGKNKSEKSVKDGKPKEGKDKSADDFEDLSSDDDDKEEDEEAEEEEEEDEEENEDDLSPAQLRKLRAAQKEEKESDYDDMDVSDESEDPEVSFPKLETPKKGKKKGTKEEESEDSDFVTPKKKKRKLRSELLDAKVSDSDSDAEPKQKKKRGRKRKKKDDEEEDEEPDPEDEVYSDDNKKKKGKRKRIKKIASSSDEEKEKEEGEEGDSEDDGTEETPGGHKRRKIRKVMANKKLKDSTKEARKAEDERRKRIEERQKEFNAFIEVEGGESEDEVAEGTERETQEEGENSIAKILGTAKKVPVTTRCVLDMEKDTKKVLIEINKTLVRKLKPHQVEAVRFMYNCLVESVERMKKEEGAGCILAHCMGLGKTLSVISFIHTMLSNVKLTKMTKCLVVCPLNTVLNWVNEFEIWLVDVPHEVDVYEMSKVKQNTERAQMLREWHQGGSGVMILGYDMYRNLVQGSHCKNKKLKAAFYECLADPGPDLVICDEGHILKNDSTTLSKSMMKIKTKRRVVLTGTPLQNNLGEYHCMVNFVKENLLGTRKEFGNRFVNPITNGQCTDSSQADVKLMKRRAHILHEMLAGCVQRKDYSALTKFLPPKFEYVVSVRMGKLQCKLYERYLQEAGVVQNEEVQGKGGRLFRDYQALMRIWTHPWVLKLDEIRQENKKTYDSEDSFIDDSESDHEDSFISASTTSESESEYRGKKKKSKGKGKKKKKGSGSSSDDDVKIVNDDEVVKKWTSKRRGNEEGAGSSWMQDMGYSAGPKEVSTEWWAEYVKEEDEFKIELSGKLTLMFEILKMCEDIGDKVLVFSQSLLSLDIIEDFLRYIDESNQKPPEEKEGEENKEKKDDTETTTNGVAEEKKEGEGKKDDKKEEDKKNRYSEYGKSWTLGADYFRMDGSTNSQQRKASQDSFNDPENYRARLFLISTKAGSLGINLVSANRVIIFDASWNPSHDIQSIFRVYRFGQVKPVYVYRFLAQGTMEEKIYERQVTKQSLSQRVVDEHQIERHFNSNDLQELYKFQPDRLDDPDRKERPLPMLPKDHMLAELMGSQKDWIVTFHEHDSLLENIVEQELSEEEKKAAWEDYENDKKGLNTALPYNNMMMMNATQRMNNAMEFQNLVLQGQANLGQEAVLQIVQDLKTRFPTLPPEVFSQRVQAVLRQVLTQRIMQQSDYQRRQMDMQKMAELNRLNQIKQQIQQQQALVNNQQRGMGLQSYAANSLLGVQALPSSGYYPSVINQNRPGATGSGQPPPAHSSSSLLQKPKSKEK